MKIIIFGTGLYYKNRKQSLGKDVEITAFLDNDLNKTGKILDGVEIVSPLKVKTLHYDRILLMSRETNHAEMIQQLTELGVGKDDIINYAELQSLLFVNCDSEKENRTEDFEKKIQKIRTECKCGSDIFTLYDELKELIKSEKKLSQESQERLKQVCKEKLIAGMNGILLEKFWI